MNFQIDGIPLWRCLIFIWSFFFLSLDFPEFVLFFEKFQIFFYSWLTTKEKLNVWIDWPGIRLCHMKEKYRKWKEWEEGGKRTSVLIAFHSFYICLFAQFCIVSMSNTNGKSANNITSASMEKYNIISHIFVLMRTTRQVYLLPLFASLVSIKTIVIYFIFF